MPSYACNTRNASGNVIEKVIEASDLSEAIFQLELGGLFPVRVTPVAPAVRKPSRPASRARSRRAGSGKKGGKVKRKELMQFSLQLSSSLSAGVPLVSGLESIRNLTRNESFKEVLSQIRADLETGRPLSEALKEHPQVFPAVYSATIGAGELSGTLDEMLENLAEFLEAEMEMRSDIRSAVMYPAIVMVTLCIAVAVLIVGVVPRFAAFYSGFNTELPLATRILITGSTFAQAYLPLILIAGAGLIFGVRRLVRRPAVRRAIDRFVLKIPVISNLITTAITLQVVQLLGLFTQAGVPIVEAMKTAADTTSNTKFKQDFLAVTDGISVGKSLTSALDAVDCLPMEARHMLANGESTGTMERACFAVVKHYKKELRYMTKTVATFIEPLLTLVLACVVLFVALAVFLPMWDLVKVVGK